MLVYNVFAVQITGCAELVLGLQSYLSRTRSSDQDKLGLPTLTCAMMVLEKSNRLYVKWSFAARPDLQVEKYIVFRLLPGFIWPVKFIPWQ